MRRRWCFGWRRRHRPRREPVDAVGTKPAVGRIDTGSRACAGHRNDPPVGAYPERGDPRGEQRGVAATRTAGRHVGVAGIGPTLQRALACPQRELRAVRLSDHDCAGILQSPHCGRRGPGRRSHQRTTARGGKPGDRDDVLDRNGDTGGGRYRRPRVGACPVRQRHARLPSTIRE